MNKHSRSPRSPLTTSCIASLASVPLYRVEYVIRTRSIPPLYWVGRARVFSEAAKRQILEGLRVSASRPARRSRVRADDGAEQTE